MRLRTRVDALTMRAAAALALSCFGAAASFAAGDAVKGQAAFVRECAICHTVDRDGPNRFGPNLFGVLGRKAGAVKDFNYSRAFKTTANWDWNEDLVAGWIGAPGQMIPGTGMGIFQGVAQTDRDDIVAYLATKR